MADLELPPPRKSPRPATVDRQLLDDLAESPSGVHDLTVLPRQLKAVGRELKRRGHTRLVYALLGCLGVGGGGVGTWNAHGRADVLEHQVHEQGKELARLRDQLDEARIELAHCNCDRRGE